MPATEGPDNADEVVQATLAAVKRHELYAIPMADTRCLWRLKRALPTPFRKLVAKDAQKLDVR